MLMAGEGEQGTPQSPETQPANVREQLDQDLISHEGAARGGDQAEPGTMRHMGAVGTEVTPVTPPMRGPGDLVGEQASDDDSIDPADEITPG